MHKGAVLGRVGSRAGGQVAGAFRVFTGDSADTAQLLRHLAEHRGGAPLWRRTRPSLLVQHAAFRPAADADAPGTLMLRYCGVTFGPA